MITRELDSHISLFFGVFMPISLVTASTRVGGRLTNVNVWDARVQYAYPCIQLAV